MNKLLIIDCGALCHRAKHSMHGLSYEEMETGVIFGFMGELLRLAKKFETCKFAFAWDSKKSVRRDMYSRYKYKRIEKKKEKTKEEKHLDNIAYKQFYEVRKEVLPLFGFSNNFIRTGYEADDIIADIVLCYYHKYECIIASNDEDLYQLLNYASIYSLKKKKVYTKKDFEKEYNVTPNQWAEVKAIAGCHTDNVEGVTGVGEKTAIKYLNNELKKGCNAFTNIRLNEKSIQRNRKLVTLPFLEMIGQFDNVKLKFKNEKFTLSNFYNMCDTYGFYSFKKNTNEWVKYFNME